MDQDTLKEANGSMAKAFKLCNRLMDAALEADPKEDQSVMRLGMEAAQMVLMGPMSHFSMMAADHAINEAVNAQIGSGSHAPDNALGHGYLIGDEPEPHTAPPE
jgi:hypothetical protein